MSHKCWKLRIMTSRRSYDITVNLDRLSYINKPCYPRLSIDDYNCRWSEEELKHIACALELFAGKIFESEPSYYDLLIFISSLKFVTINKDAILTLILKRLVKISIDRSIIYLLVNLRKSQKYSYSQWRKRCKGIVSTWGIRESERCYQAMLNRIKAFIIPDLANIVMEYMG